jgi:hypothetical protein
MLPRQLKLGDVVQISPEGDHAFGGCFAQVEEPKPWGMQGWVAMPTERGKPPARAYVRCNWDDIEFIGSAIWVGDL